MIMNIPTLLDRIPRMTQQELEDLADGEALAMTDSSRLEGLTLDYDRIRTELLAGYRAIQEQGIS